jgi:hypothetical protein
MGAKLHAAEQLAALPVSKSTVQALPSSQPLGHVDGKSQVSPVSTTPFPQLDEQSLSLFALHPGAQHPSPDWQLVMGVCWQAAEQLPALPVKTSTVQAFPSLQLVGHDEGGSQVSPTSTTPSPHRAQFRSLEMKSSVCLLAWALMQAEVATSMWTKGLLCEPVA